MERGGRLAVCDYFDLEFIRDVRKRKWYRYYYPVYSAGVSYTIGDCTYEADANDYTIEEPIIGQRVYVHYNPPRPYKDVRRRYSG